MKLRIPRDHILNVLRTYQPVNQYRVYNNKAIFFYTDDPKFAIPVDVAYQIMNTQRKIKKVVIKNNKIYFYFKPDAVQHKVVMRMNYHKKLDFAKCYNAFSRFGKVLHLTTQDNTVCVKYEKLVSYFFAYPNFSGDISFEQESTLDKMFQEIEMEQPNYYPYFK